MATRIIECGNIGRRNDGLPVVPEAQVIQPAMTASATPGSSVAFSANGPVCIQSDEAIYVAFGVSPTATTDCYRIAAGGEQFFEVRTGWKVSIRT